MLRVGERSGHAVPAVCCDSAAGHLPVSGGDTRSKNGGMWCFWGSDSSTRTVQSARKSDRPESVSNEFDIRHAHANWGSPPSPEGTTGATSLAASGEIKCAKIRLLQVLGGSFQRPSPRIRISRWGWKRCWDSEGRLSQRLEKSRSSNPILRPRSTRREVPPARWVATSMRRIYCRLAVVVKLSS